MPWYELIFRVVLSLAVGCIIGAEREHQHRPAGLRTHILVCLGACLVAMMEHINMQQVADMNAVGVSVTLGRMSAQVISGIGFLGAGTIFMASRKIAGLTTAASLWCTACLGLAAGMGHYMLLGAGCAVVILTLALLPHLVPHDNTLRLSVTCVDRQAVMPLISRLFEEKRIRLLDTDFADVDGLCRIDYTISLPRKTDLPRLVQHLADDERIRAVRTLND